MSVSNVNAGLFAAYAAVNGTQAIGSSAGENVWGTNAGDTVVGGGGGDSLYGFFGNDLLSGGAGGDRLDGGEGTDTADFSSEGGVSGLSFLGRLEVPPLTTTFGGTTFGGISSIDFNPLTGRYVAMSDDQPNSATDAIQGATRYYDLSLTVSASGLSGFAINGVTELRTPTGGSYAPATIDPEEIRLNPVTNQIVWTSEGFNTATNRTAPFVREAGLGGSFLRDFGVPGYYVPTETTGVRQNTGFEALSYTPDYRTLFVGAEGALIQDGTAATLTTTSSSRILRFDAATGAATGEFVYVNEVVQNAPNPAGSFTVNGLTEFLALDDTTLIALERSFSVGVTGNDVRAYLVRLDGATNVLGRDSIAGQSVTAVSKTLLFDFDTLGFTIDNLEGITRGPTLADGRQTLIIVSDDNFSAASVNQFLAFAINGGIGVAANLEAGIAHLGAAPTAAAPADTLVSIENLIGTASNDQLTGNGGANRLEGGAGADTLNASGGDDVIVGGAGADVINGGSGTDSVLFARARSGYTITASGANVIVADTTAGAPEGSDTITGVERLVFLDQTVEVTGVAPNAVLI